MTYGPVCWDTGSGGGVLGGDRHKNVKNTLLIGSAIPAALMGKDQNRKGTSSNF
jgi:hypothetical protein